MKYLNPIIFSLLLTIGILGCADASASVHVKQASPQSGEESAARAIYPNPCTDALYVKGYEVKSLRIFDLIGNLVKAQNTGNYVDTSSLPAGIYVLEITEPDRITKERFIKRL